MLAVCSLKPSCHRGVESLLRGEQRARTLAMGSYTPRQVVLFYALERVKDQRYAEGRSHCGKPWSRRRSRIWRGCRNCFAEHPIEYLQLLRRTNVVLWRSSSKHGCRERSIRGLCILHNSRPRSSFLFTFCVALQACARHLAQRFQAMLNNPVHKPT